MNEATPSYTTIQHIPRIRYGLSNNDYCIAALIYHMSNNPKAPIKGWCMAGKETMGKYFNISRQAVHGIISKLEEKGLVARQEQTGFVRTTQRWYDEFECLTPCKESLHPVNLVDKTCKESLQEGVKKLDTGCKESLHYNNTITIEDNNKDKVVVGGESQEAVLNFSLEAKKEKENTPRSAAPPKRKRTLEAGVLFTESPFADVRFMKSVFEGTDYELADLDYYHEAVQEWATRKQIRKIDWKRTIENWIWKDYKDKRLRTKSDRISQGVTGSSQLAQRATLAQQVLTSISYDNEGNRI